MNAQLKALYIDTLKKELRNKTLLFALIFSTISIFIGYSILKLFLNNGVEINSTTTTYAVNIMMSFLNFWGLIISIFFGVNAVRSDFQDNIIYQYLSFPISRTKYFLVRLAGTWSMVFAFYLYSYILTFVLFAIVNKGFHPTLGQVGSIFIMGAYTFICVSLAFLVSLFMDKLGAFIALIFFTGLIKYANSTFQDLNLSNYFHDFSAMKVLLLVVHWLVPRMGTISDIGNGILVGIKLEVNYPIEIIHFFISSMLLLWVINYQVKKRDF